MYVSNPLLYIIDLTPKLLEMHSAYSALLKHQATSIHSTD